MSRDEKGPCRINEFHIMLEVKRHCLKMIANDLQFKSIYQLVIFQSSVKLPEAIVLASPVDCVLSFKGKP